MDINDLISYLITLVLGVLGGSGGTFLFMSKRNKVVQKNNIVKNGDIVGGDKCGNKYEDSKR